MLFNCIAFWDPKETQNGILLSYEQADLGVFSVLLMILGAALWGQSVGAEHERKRQERDGVSLEVFRDSF